MATHSSVLAWRITGMGGLPSLGSHRVGHDSRDLAAAAAAVPFKMVDYLLFLLASVSPFILRFFTLCVVSCQFYTFDFPTLFYFTMSENLCCSYCLIDKSCLTRDLMGICLIFQQYFF